MTDPRNPARQWAVGSFLPRCVAAPDFGAAYRDLFTLQWRRQWLLFRRLHRAGLGLLHRFRQSGKRIRTNLNSSPRRTIWGTRAAPPRGVRPATRLTVPACERPCAKAEKNAHAPALHVVPEVMFLI